MRCDLTRADWDSVGTIEDFPQAVPRSGEDIFLLAKRWMADSESVRLIALIPADKMQEMRVGMVPPAGLAARRPITAGVMTNLHKQVPKLRKAGEINPAAASYLLQWVSGVLPKVPKPTDYPVLSYRWDNTLRDEVMVPGIPV